MGRDALDTDAILYGQLMKARESTEELDWRQRPLELNINSLMLDGYFFNDYLSGEGHNWLGCADWIVQTEKDVPKSWTQTASHIPLNPRRAPGVDFMQEMIRQETTLLPDHNIGQVRPCQLEASDPEYRSADHINVYIDSTLVATARTAMILAVEELREYNYEWMFHRRGWLMAFTSDQRLVGMVRALKR